MNKAKRYSPEVKERAAKRTSYLAEKRTFLRALATREGLPVAVGCDGFDREQDWMHARDPARLGEVSGD